MRMIEVTKENNCIEENNQGKRSHRRGRGRRRQERCDARRQEECEKVHILIEHRSFELFPLKAIKNILAEGRLPVETFRIKEQSALIARLLRRQQRVMLTRLIMGRVETEYKILFIRRDVLYYCSPADRNKIYAISFSRLRRENWFVRFYNQWKYIC